MNLAQSVCEAPSHYALGAETRIPCLPWWYLFWCGFSEPPAAPHGPICPMDFAPHTFVCVRFGSVSRRSDGQAAPSPPEPTDTSQCTFSMASLFTICVWFAIPVFSRFLTPRNSPPSPPFSPPSLLRPVSFIPWNTGSRVCSPLNLLGSITVGATQFTVPFFITFEFFFRKKETKKRRRTLHVSSAIRRTGSIVCCLLPEPPRINNQARNKGTKFAVSFSILFYSSSEETQKVW